MPDQSAYDEAGPGGWPKAMLDTKSNAGSKGALAHKTNDRDAMVAVMQEEDAKRKGIVAAASAGPDSAVQGKSVQAMAASGGPVQMDGTTEEEDFAAFQANFAKKFKADSGTSEVFGKLDAAGAARQVWDATKAGVTASEGAMSELPDSGKYKALGVEDADGKVTGTQDKLTEAMASLEPLVAILMSYVAKTEDNTKHDWAFWSGNPAKAAAAASGAVSLEGSALGGIFDEMKLPKQNMALWGAISKAYAKWALENASEKTYKGFVGVGADRQQSVYNAVEKPTFDGITKGKIDVEWYAVVPDQSAYNEAGADGWPKAVLDTKSNAGSKGALAHKTNDRDAMVALMLEENAKRKAIGAAASGSGSASGASALQGKAVQAMEAPGGGRGRFGGRLPVDSGVADGGDGGAVQLDADPGKTGGKASLADFSAEAGVTSDDVDAAGAKVEAMNAMSLEDMKAHLGKAKDTGPRSTKEMLAAIGSGVLPRWVARVGAKAGFERGTFGNPKANQIFATEPSDVAGLGPAEALVKVGWTPDQLGSQVGKEIAMCVLDTKKAAEPPSDGAESAAGGDAQADGGGAPQVTEMNWETLAEVAKDEANNKRLYDQLDSLTGEDGIKLEKGDLTTMFKLAAKTPVGAEPDTPDPTLKEKYKIFRKALGSGMAASELFSGMGATISETGDVGAREVMLMNNASSFKLSPENSVIHSLGTLNKAEVDALIGNS